MTQSEIEIVNVPEESESILLLNLDKSEQSNIQKHTPGNNEDMQLSDELQQVQNFWGNIEMRSMVKVLASVALFFISAPCLIMVNKHLLKEKHFKYPMMLSGIGLFSSTVVTQLLRISGLLVLERPVTRKLYMKSIFPIGLFMALTLNFGNRVYLYLSVSLIQMLKAGTPAITLFIVWAAGLSNPSSRIVIAVLIISLGVAISSVTSDQSSWSFIGFFIMFLSEVSEAVRCALIQYLLADLKFSALEGLSYFAPTALIWMIALIVFHELPQFIHNQGFLIIYDNIHLFTLCFVLGFFVNVAGFFVMKTTSVVTLKILAQIRNIGLILVNVIFWKEVVTSFQALGYLVTLAGFAWYQYESLKKNK